MASTLAIESIPRPLRVFGIPLAGVFFISLFLYLGFPYDQLGKRIAAEAQRSYGVRVEFRKLSPRLHIAGPGIEANAVQATLAGGEAYAFDRVRLRPAWSIAWLRGNPAVYAEVTSAMGDAAGTLVLGATPAWYGDFEGVAVGRLPLANLTSLARLDGLIDARIDVQIFDAGPVGEATFTAKEGSLGIAQFPLDIPFNTLSGSLLFGGETFVSVQRFEFEGPMVNGSVTGSIASAARFAQAPLRLEAVLQVEPNMQAAVNGAGIRVGRDGTAKLRISGTVSRPDIR